MLQLPCKTAGVLLQRIRARRPCRKRNLEYGLPAVEMKEVRAGIIQAPVFVRRISLRFRSQLAQFAVQRTEPDRSGNPAHKDFAMFTGTKRRRLSSVQHTQSRSDLTHGISLELIRKRGVPDSRHAGRNGKIPPCRQTPGANQAGRLLRIGKPQGLAAFVVHDPLPVLKCELRKERRLLRPRIRGEICQSAGKRRTGAECSRGKPVRSIHARMIEITTGIGLQRLLPERTVKEIPRRPEHRVLHHILVILRTLAHLEADLVFLRYGFQNFPRQRMLRRRMHIQGTPQHKMLSPPLGFQTTERIDGYPSDGVFHKFRMCHSPRIQAEIFQSVKKTDGMFRARQLPLSDQRRQRFCHGEGCGDAGHVIRCMRFICMGGQKETTVVLSPQKRSDGGRFSLISAGIHPITHRNRARFFIAFHQLAGNARSQRKSDACLIPAINLPRAEQIIEPPPGILKRRMNRMQIDRSHERFAGSPHQGFDFRTRRIMRNQSDERFQRSLFRQSLHGHNASCAYAAAVRGKRHGAISAFPVIGNPFSADFRPCVGDIPCQREMTVRINRFSIGGKRHDFRFEPETPVLPGKPPDTVRIGGVAEPEGKLPKFRGKRFDLITVHRIVDEPVNFIQITIHFHSLKSSCSISCAAASSAASPYSAVASLPGRAYQSEPSIRSNSTHSGMTARASLVSSSPA